ncbi:MAG: poly-gamma-glutamate hydrolase family protein [Deltaproteobacteria bacterium]
MSKPRNFLHTYLPGILIALLLSVTVFVGTASADIYPSATSLEAHKKLGADYRILQTVTPSQSIVISIHGGNIERGTNQIAQAVASQGGFDYYGFIGLRGSGLHVTSTNFNDSCALRMVRASNKTLSIHGCTGSNRVTYLGGLDKAFVAEVKKQLVNAGFIVKNPPSGLGGSGTANICNRNSKGKGAQLELTSGLRNHLMNNKTDFDRYVNALVKAES